MDMNRPRYKILVLMLAASFVLNSCTQEDASDGMNSGTLQLDLQLGLPVETEVVARATTTEIEVSDVWVVQYIAGNPDGVTEEEKKSRMIKKNYSNANISWQNDKGRYVVSDSAGETAVFLNQNSEFYVIANANAITADHAGLSALTESSPLSDLTTLTKEIIDATVIDVTAEPKLLVAGPVMFTQKAGGNNTSATFVAPLQRAYSRVTVSWNFEPEVFTGSSFTATSLIVRNLPQNMSFLERGGAESGAYPQVDDILVDEVTLYDGTDPTVNAATFYMGENLRGIGTAITAAEKNSSANGPLQADGNTRSLNGCTYVTLSGSYKYDNSHVAEVGVKYCFYLGGNLINDYNVRRGYDYKLNITVSGANSSDLRVSITDGNVIYFDQVTEIVPIDIEM